MSNDDLHHLWINNWQRKLKLLSMVIFILVYWYLSDIYAMILVFICVFEQAFNLFIIFSLQNFQTSLFRSSFWIHNICLKQSNIKIIKSKSNRVQQKPENSGSSSPESAAIESLDTFKRNCFRKVHFSKTYCKIITKIIIIRCKNLHTRIKLLCAAELRCYQKSIKG